MTAFGIALAVLAVPAFSAGALDAPQVTREGAEAPNEQLDFRDLGLEVTTVLSDLDTPWDLVWGPDGWIWFTERPGVISRVDPETGERQVLARPEVTERGESGLMGLELHPDFPDTPYLYVSQSYRADSGIANRIVRFRYSEGAGEPSLTNLTVLVEGIPGNSYHDGSRLVAGPDGFLYATTGDAGRRRWAQDTNSLAGKILRMDYEGNPVPGNPFGNLVYSYGHRNAQGLVFHPETAELFITEHGPRDNDEVSRVVRGGNFGWPEVRGFCDGDVPGEKTFCTQNRNVEPLAAWTPTIAPAGADFYHSDRIAGWDGSFLFTTLKGSALIRLEFSEDHSRVTQQQVIAEDEYGRLRDVLVGPDGTVYLATSNRDGRGRPAPQDDRILAVRPY